MRKYYYILKLSVQRQFSDAAKPFIWILGESSQAFAFAFIWLAVATGNDNIGNNKTSDLITYYFFVFINWFLIGGFSHMIMGQSILDGSFSNELVKPVIPFSMAVLKEQGWKVFGLISGIPLLGILLLVFHEYVSFDFTAEDVLRCIPAIILGAGVFGMMDWIIGMASFWAKRTEGARYLFTSLMSVLGGYIVPFALLPEGLARVAEWLPFRYTFAFAAQIFQGQLDQGEILFGFSVQIVWIVLLFILVRFIFNMGILQYESYGG